MQMKGSISDYIHKNKQRSNITYAQRNIFQDFVILSEISY